MIRLTRLLVATDFSDASDAALEHGRALARSFGATLHLLHVMENLFLRPVPGDPYALKAALLRQLQKRLTTDDREALRGVASIEAADDAAAAIVSYARTHTIDLVVMGTHGRRGIDRLLLGSVAETVVRTAPCPVLTVRRSAHDFVAPDPPGATATQESGGLS